jgi:hypothetical protein
MVRNNKKKGLPQETPESIGKTTKKEKVRLDRNRGNEETRLLVPRNRQISRCTNPESNQ